MDNPQGLKKLILKQLIEKGEYDKALQAINTEDSGNQLSTLVRPLSAVADMLTSNAKGVLMEDLKKQLSEETLSGLESLKKDLEEAQQTFKKELQDALKTDRDELSSSVIKSVTDAKSALETTLAVYADNIVENKADAIFATLAENAKLTEEEVADIVSNAALEVESQIASIIGDYVSETGITTEQISDFKEAVTRLLPQTQQVTWDSIIGKPDMSQGGTNTNLVKALIAEALEGTASSFTIQEEDGSPAGQFSTLKVTNGTLTDNGDGTASLNIPPPGGGEANTASNVGTAGVGVFKQKTSANLEFKNINAGSAAVTITDDTGNNEVDIDLSAASKASLALADSATQPEDLATVATTGAYSDLTGKPTLGTAAAANTGDFATAAQGTLADSALQSVVAGTNVTVDNTDPQNPVISSTGGAGISDGDKGDITVSGSGATWTIDNNVVTFAKMQDIATDHFIGRHTSGSGDPQQVSATQARAILNVEDGADVTDTTNVTAAGALMDSEVTNLAAVKAFDPADYATAAQGATADTALQPSDIASGTITALTGALNLSGGSDGDVLTKQADGSLALETPSGGGTNTYFNTTFRDQTPDGTSTYGALSGTVNGTNTTFTVSQGSYRSGTLKVFVNGVLQNQNGDHNWTETTPGSGTFDFEADAIPQTNDVIFVEYEVQTVTSDTVITNAIGTPANLGTTGRIVDDYDAGDTLTAGFFVRLATDGRWQYTDASAAATSDSKIGFTLSSSTADNPISVAAGGEDVKVRNDGWSFGASDYGKAVYLSETAAEMTLTAPTASNTAVRYIGFVAGPTSIWFNPEQRAYINP